MKNMILLPIFSMLIAFNAFAGGANIYTCDWKIPDFRIQREEITSSKLVISMFARLQLTAGGQNYEARCDNAFEANRWDRFTCVLDETTTALVKVNNLDYTCTAEVLNPEPQQLELF